MKLLWSPLALERVGEIAAWIQEESPGAAARWVEEIFSAVERLQQFPESGRHVPEVQHRQDLREVIYQSYRIIYRLEAERVLILTVRHSRQLTQAEDLEP